VQLRRFLANGAIQLIAGATGFYAAIRVYITVMSLLPSPEGGTVSLMYGLRLANALVLGLVLFAWLGASAFLHSRVRRARTQRDALQMGAQYAGIAILVVESANALLVGFVPQFTGGPLTTTVTVLVWITAIALLAFGFWRKPAISRPREDGN